MVKILARTVTVVVGLAILAAGHAAWGRDLLNVRAAPARSSSMPAQPLVLYLAPGGTTRGIVDAQTIQSRGALSAPSWAVARQQAGLRPLDALMIDGTFLAAMEPQDRDWLRQQFHNGVVIIALGAPGPPDAVLARALGLKTLKDPNEVDLPQGPTQYLLVDSLLLGQPGDVKTLEAADWVDLAQRGQLQTISNIQGPTTTVFGRALGQVDTLRDFNLLFMRIHDSIQGMYDARAEFQARLAQWSHSTR